MHRNLRRNSIVFVCMIMLSGLCLCINPAAYADTASMNPSMDTTRDMNTGNTFPEGDNSSVPGCIVNWVGSYESWVVLDSRSFTKFDLSSISGTVDSATFKIYIKQIDGTPFVNLYGSNDDSWIRSLSTGIPSGDVAIVSNDTDITLNSWKEFDVTSFISGEVAGDKIATFIFTGNTSGDDDFAYCSEEDAAYKPILEITYTPLTTVDSVSVPGNGTYLAGDNLDFTVNFDNSVTVDTAGGTPYIPLTLNSGGTANASYLSGSGTANLVFRYTVQSGDEDSDGVTVGAAIAANGGSLQNGSGSDAVLTLNDVGDTSGILIDAASPQVSSVSVPTDGSYRAGQNLDLTVHFDENVTVNTTGGTPYIPLTLDSGGTANASYSSGSGTADLIFRYTVQAGDEDSDGIVAAAAIEVNGGTLQDAAGNDALLTLNNVGATGAVLVDTTQPEVLSVSVPGDGSYGAGQNLDFTVHFNEEITASTTGGTPYISVTLDSGGITNASYLSGSGTAALVFRYTVQAGDADSDGITVGAAITVNGGTLQDAAGNNTVLTLNNVGAAGGILVDGIAPVVASVGVPGGGTYLLGQSLDFTVNFDEAITVNTAGGTPYIPLTLNSGGTTNASYLSGSGTTALVFTYTVQADDEDSDGIAVGAAITANGGTLRDAAGNNAVLTHNNVGDPGGILIDGIAPVVLSVSVPANATYLAGQNLNFTVNFDDLVTVNTVGGTPYIPLTLNSGGTTNASYLSGSGTTALVFRYTVQEGDDDNDGITVDAAITANGGTLQDSSGNDAVLTLNNVGNTALVLVDALAPSVSSVVAPANGSYPEGQNLEFTVNFDENVFVNAAGGTPYVPLTLNSGGTANASYLSGSGTTALVFRYTVQAGDGDSDGVTVGTAIAPNGGTLQDAAGNDALLELNNVGATGAVLVDTTPAQVSSVSVPADGSYRAGQNLDLTVHFDENVTVNTAGGTPYIPVTLDSGGTVQASYLSGSGTTALVFRYTVQAGDGDSDGIAVGAGITANGGTLQDAAGNDALLTLNNVGAAGAVLVDTTPPEVSSVSVPGDGSYRAGQNLDFTVNFNEAVTVTTTGGTPYISATLDSGGTTNASYLSGSGTAALVFCYTVQAGDEDSNGITVGAGITANGGILQDAAGNDALLTLNNVGASGGILIDGIAPVVLSVSVPGNGTYLGGQSLDFTVNFDDSVTIDTVSGTPYVTITLESGTVQPSYSSGSGTTALVFSYTVQVGDEDSDGIAVGAAITANGGTLQDAVGNNAVLNLNNVGNTSGICIDAAAPAVTSVNVPANGTYLAGQSLDFTVNFDDCVTVNTVGGTPHIPITLESGTVQAAYSSGSGTTALVFTYTVQSGDEDSDGITVGGAISANGGMLQDNSGNDALLTLHNVGNTALVLVDALEPNVSSVTVPTNGSYREGQSLDFTVNYSENVLVNTTGGTPYIPLTLNSGGTANVSYLSGSGTANLVFRYTVQAGDGDSDGIALDAAITADGGILQDVAGNNALLTLNNTGNTDSILVDTAAPELINCDRIDDYHILLSLSENCINIPRSDDGGFNVAETGLPGITYCVSSLEQGSDSSYIVLTVPDMGISAKEGVAVRYVAGGNGTIQDAAGNIMETDNTGVAVSPWDVDSPAISSATLVDDNAYMDINFSEGVYGADDGNTALTADKLSLVFSQNGGKATSVAISSVKKNDNTAENQASSLTGGETVVRVFLTVTGTPHGAETIEIKPQSSYSIYDQAGNAVSTAETSGVIKLNKRSSGGNDSGGGGGSSASTENTGSTVVIDTSVHRETAPTPDGQMVETFYVQPETGAQIEAARAQGGTTVQIAIDNTETAITGVIVPSTVLDSAMDMNISISTHHASLQIPAALVNALAESGQDLSVSIARGSSGEIHNPADTTVLGDSTIIDTELKGPVLVTISLAGITIPEDRLEREDFLARLAVFAIHGGGEEQIINGTINYDADGNPVAMSFTVDKFSTFSIISLGTRTIILTVDHDAASINGIPCTLDASPFIDPATDRTLAPIRFISEALGASVEWMPATRQVTIKDGSKQILLTIDATDVLVNGQKVQIDCAPVIQSDRTYLPLRFISETLGADVAYDETTRQISIIRDYQ